MAAEFHFSDVGEGIHEGEVVKWLVKEGDRVQEHQPLVQVETDKAIVELPSPVTGTVLQLHKQVGTVVKVGELLATIGDAREVRKEEQVLPRIPQRPEEERVEQKPLGEVPTTKALFAVRALAKQLKVDLRGVRGTGQEGSITEADVRAAAQNAVPQKQGPTLAFEEFGKILRIPLRGMRKAIAKNMSVSAQKIPHVTHADQADVTALWDLRQQYKEKAEVQGFGLTFLPFVIKAVTIALKAHPFLNASLDEEKNEIVVKQYYNVGFAVDTSDGLLVPVLKNADHLSIFHSAKQIAVLAEKARSRELALDDMRGGGFTITNIGSIGGMFFTPIINYPECAILGMGKIREQPVVQDGKIVVRKILPLSLSFDHRIVDGAKAARFLNDVMKHLENPNEMLMDAE